MNNFSDRSFENYFFDGKYHYDFLPSGFFYPVNLQGEDSLKITIALSIKAFSHFCWIGMWFLFSYYLQSSTTALRFFSAMVILHLFVLGCRMTTLFLRGNIRLLLFPPFWVRITQRILAGEGLELLKSYSLDNHPGLLVNLALAQMIRNERQESKVIIEKARALLFQCSNSQEP